MTGLPKRKIEAEAKREAGLRRWEMIGLLVLALAAATIIAVALFVGGGVDAGD